MDLGTMAKKLKNQEYNSKQQFIDDLNLIYSNCFLYNSAEDSIYRQHIQMLRDKWTYLLKSVPEIVIGKPAAIEKQDDPKNNPPAPPVTSAASTATAGPQIKKPVKDDPLDDLDDLLNAHLESLSDTESCPSPKKQRKHIEIPSFPPKQPQIHKEHQEQQNPRYSHFNNLSNSFSKRCDKLMTKYGNDCKIAWGVGKSNNSNNNNNKHNDKNNVMITSNNLDNMNNSDSVFVFPELVYFFNTVPDTHLIKLDRNFATETARHYSSVRSMNRYYDNFRILQSIRELRKHILEGSRAQVPSIEHLKTPSNRFDTLEDVLKEKIENGIEAKALLRKVITLFLAQAGFERKCQGKEWNETFNFSLFVVISNSALHALYELVDWHFKKLFDTLKLVHDEFSNEKDPADILRLVLLQMNVKHLSDLEEAISEDSYAKSRLDGLLNIICGKVQEYQSTIRTQNNPEEAEDLDEGTEGETGSEGDGDGEGEGDEDLNEDGDEDEDNNNVDEEDNVEEENEEEEDQEDDEEEEDDEA